MLICRYFIEFLASACPPRTSLYQPGCSTLRRSHLGQSLAADYRGDVRGEQQVGSRGATPQLLEPSLHSSSIASDRREGLAASSSKWKWMVSVIVLPP